MIDFNAPDGRCMYGALLLMCVFPDRIQTMVVNALPAVQIPQPGTQAQFFVSRPEGARIKAVSVQEARC